MFSRRVQDFIVVTVMTVLIWLYAEGANVQTYSPADAVTLNVSLTADDMVIIEQKPLKVSVGFKGAQAELDQLRRSLGGKLEVELEFTEPGAKSVPMSEVVQQADALQTANVNVTRVEPATLELQIDRLVRREVPVTFRPRDIPLVPGVKIEPSVVTITAPESRFTLLGDAELTLEATVNPELLRTLKAGEQHRVNARLSLPQALAVPHALLSPSEVVVTFGIGKQDDTVELSSVPVWIGGPPQDEYAVTHEPILRNVTVSGPADEMSKVRDKTVRIIAVLWLGSDELAKAAGNGEQVAPVQFIAPAQFKVSSPNSTVRYTVTRKSM